MYIKGCSNYNGTFVLVDNNYHALNTYIDEIPFGGLPHTFFPWNPAIQNNEPHKSLYVTSQTYKLEYSSLYPPGNTDYNSGLALDVHDACLKMFGDFILVEACFVGSDGGTSHVLKVVITRKEGVPRVINIGSNNSDYSITGTTITFTGLPVTGGWYKMAGIYRKEA
mgnify:CR=1 FL=1